ncbi:MAG: hypothetical protein KY462_01420 [Actinobacteria bacterium]|nr:hypothetical protein [Actinomycetota bacterium]
MPPSPRQPGIVPDDLPKRGLFREPIRVEDVEVLPPEQLGDGRLRVTFRIQVRDADGRPCPDLAVIARIAGPDRAGQKMGHTDLFGQVRFRMAGPEGRYRFEVLDVAAGALQLERGSELAVAAAETTASVQG